MLIGAPGLGKTMLAVRVATKQVQLGYTARFVTAQALANQLGRANTAVRRKLLPRPLLSCDVLVLDELGYLPTVPAFGPALYELVADRYERRRALITSNRACPSGPQVARGRQPGLGPDRPPAPSRRGLLPERPVLAAEGPRPGRQRSRPAARPAARLHGGRPCLSARGVTTP